LATDLKGEVKVGKVDATENKDVSSKYGVQGYPTIKFFPAGKKDEDSAIPYEGQRNAAAMAEWAREQTKDLKIF
jgi:protein disulfide-isomerase A6